MSSSKELKASIIIPFIHLDRIDICIDHAVNNAGIDKTEFELIAEYDHCRIGCPEMVKRMVGWTKSDIVVFIGDDTRPQKDWLKNALAHMDQFQNGWGLVGFGDKVRNIRPVDWAAHKNLLKYLDGEFFHTGYWHCYSDNELHIRTALLNRYKYASDVIVDHDHPAIADNKDESYNLVYSMPFIAHDEQLFMERINKGWMSTLQ